MCSCGNSQTLPFVLFGGLIHFFLVSVDQIPLDFSLYFTCLCATRAIIHPACGGGSHYLIPWPAKNECLVPLACRLCHRVLGGSWLCCPRSRLGVFGAPGTLTLPSGPLLGDAPSMSALSIRSLWSKHWFLLGLLVILSRCQLRQLI